MRNIRSEMDVAEEKEKVFESFKSKVKSHHYNFSNASGVEKYVNQYPTLSNEYFVPLGKIKHNNQWCLKISQCCQKFG